MTLGENIRNKRLEYDIEQQELAQRIGVNKATICGIETLPICLINFFFKKCSFAFFV